LSRASDIDLSSLVRRAPGSFGRAVFLGPSEHSEEVDRVDARCAGGARVRSARGTRWLVVRAGLLANVAAELTVRGLSEELGGDFAEQEPASERGVDHERVLADRVEESARGTPALEDRIRVACSGLQ
jgi:hypothetical protein